MRGITIIAITASLIAFNSSLYSMMALPWTSQGLVQEIRNGSNQEEKEVATRFLAQQINSNELYSKIYDIRTKLQKAKNDERRERARKTIDILSESIKSDSLEAVQHAFAQLDHMKAEYGWREWLFGIYGEPEISYDDAFLFDTTFITRSLFYDICTNDSNPTIIHEIQKKYDVRSEAQEALWYSPGYFFKHPQTLNTFLDMGIKPYSGHSYR